MEILVLILVVIVVVVIVAGAGASRSGSPDNGLATLKERYEAALKSEDKRMALDCGRAYYAALRNPKQLTMFDELAISNDLAAMR